MPVRSKDKQWANRLLKAPQANKEIQFGVGNESSIISLAFEFMFSSIVSMKIH